MIFEWDISLSLSLSPSLFFFFLLSGELYIDSEGQRKALVFLIKKSKGRIFYYSPSCRTLLLLPFSFSSMLYTYHPMKNHKSDAYASCSHLNRINIILCRISLLLYFRVRFSFVRRRVYIWHFFVFNSLLSSIQYHLYIIILFFCKKKKKRSLSTMSQEYFDMSRAESQISKDSLHILLLLHTVAGYLCLQK